MSNYIKCKNCGTEIEVSEALSHQIEEQVVQSLTKKHKIELEEAKVAAIKQATEKAAEEIQSKLKNTAEENSLLKEKYKKVLEEATEAEKSKREMKETMERMELENQKRLNEELDKVKDQAYKLATEKSSDEMAQLKKQIDDYKKNLEEANYKLSQKSQQLQGEVLELDLQQRLTEEFPDDEITPVGKGMQGADIVHMVKGKSGREAGIILWETKDAKWTPTWLPKLREDGRAQGATALVLVTKNLPREVENFAIMEGVVITTPNNALSLAGILRRSLLQIALAKLTAEQSGEKLSDLYDYLQSEAFRHRFEAFAEGLKGLSDDLEGEKRAMERVWKKREMEIKRVSTNISRMYGEMQAVMGNSLPEIRVLSLPGMEEEQS